MAEQGVTDVESLWKGDTSLKSFRTNDLDAYYLQKFFLKFGTNVSDDKFLPKMRMF